MPQLSYYAAVNGHEPHDPSPGVSEFPPPRPWAAPRHYFGYDPAADVQRAARRRRRRWQLFVTIALVIFVFALGAGFVIQGVQSLDKLVATAPHSTPRSQWTKGEVPALYQTDEQWADVPYAEGTMGDSGCGPTALTMVYIALTGHTDYDPAAMARFSAEGGYVDGGLTRWALMTEGAKTLGLKAKMLPTDLAIVREALREGSPIIASMGPGDFTTTGHFIVLTELHEGNRVAVRDPNSEERSLKLWDLAQVIAQASALWSFA